MGPDALAERGFDRRAAGMRDAAGESGPGFEARLRATGAAYVAFASSNPALLELMYASKPHGEAPVLQAAMAVVLSVVLDRVANGVADGVLAAGDPGRYALLLFATIRGIAALVTNGIVGPDTVSNLLDDAGTTFIRGSAP